MASGAGGGVCGGCKWEEYRIVSVVYGDNAKALNIFREHGVLPSSVSCPYCDRPCSLSQSEDRRTWRCTAHFTEKRKKQKKRRRSCPFSVSDNRGTFLEQTKLEPWKVLLFINLFVLKRWSHRAVTRNLEVSVKTSVDWRSFCSEVCESWVGKAEPIGGPGVVVEIDETHFVKRKFNRGRVLSSVWLFGGIERGSDRKFIVPLSERLSDVCGRRDSDTLIPLIEKHVLRGTVIHTDCWAAYRCLRERGFEHYTVNHQENFVDPTDKTIRTQKVERLWRDVKEWCSRPGNRVKYVHQYLGRYVFLKQVPSEERVHHFLVAAAALYPHQTPSTSTDRNNNSSEE